MKTIGHIILCLLVFSPIKYITISDCLKKANNRCICYDFRNGRINKHLKYSPKVISFVSHSLEDNGFKIKKSDTLLIDLCFGIIINRPDIIAISSVDTMYLQTIKNNGSLQTAKKPIAIDKSSSSFYSAIKNLDIISFKQLYSKYGDITFSVPNNDVFRIEIINGKIVNASRWIFEIHWDPYSP